MECGKPASERRRYTKLGKPAYSKYFPIVDLERGHFCVQPAGSYFIGNPIKRSFSIAMGTDIACPEQLTSHSPDIRMFTAIDRPHSYNQSPFVERYIFCCST